MKFISIIGIALLTTVTQSTAMAKGDPGTKSVFKVSEEESTLTWNAYKVTGEHKGTIDILKGQIEYQDGALIGGSFIVNMQSITVTDLTGEYKDKLENHLKSDDFFSVKENPTARFAINEVEPQAEVGKYIVRGDLTIKEQTHEIEFPVLIIEKEETRIARADLEIDRSKYNVRYRSGSFFDNLGDKLIYDNFDLSVRLVAQK